MSTLIAILSLLLNGGVLYFLYRQSLTKTKENPWNDLFYQLQTLQAQQEKLEKRVREEMGYNRQEWNTSSLENRRELQQSFTTLTKATLSTLRESASQQKDLLDSFSKQLNDLTRMNEQKFDHLRTQVEEKLAAIQTENQKKLEEMRKTVDEKLHNTLEKRLGESFQLVSERLEQVHKSLGETQNLATVWTIAENIIQCQKPRGVGRNSTGKYFGTNVVFRTI